MNKLEVMRVFVEVVECQSFVEASRHLDLSAPTVTKSVAQLEEHLGVRLLNRTTRNVRLTDSGLLFFNDAKRILQEVEQAEANATGIYSQPKGTLSITAPVLFGQKHVMPVVYKYLQLNPEVSVNALFYDRIGNLMEEGLDIAIRIGHLKDSGLFATQVGSIRKVVCGAPDYFKNRGYPQQPSDLLHHKIIQAGAVENSTTWKFESNGNTTKIKVSPRLNCSQNAAAVEAAKHGLGITRLMSYQAGEEFENGSLERVLIDYESDPLPVSIVYLEGRKSNSKIRSFIDLAVEMLRDNPYIHP